MTEIMDVSVDEAAVAIRNCSKTYERFRWRQKNKHEKRMVLDKVDVTVTQGSIYALLGPSGCGKTTLMNCLTGRLQVNGGSVVIFGMQLGSRNHENYTDIGFMPQETSLFTFLTIEETFEYYGRLFGMSKKSIKLQKKILVDFFKLPPKCTVVKYLSGGEHRRVSFSVAVLHNPRLLILDEPTVGVDPIGRQRMLCYLMHLVKHDFVTIILSTHYIEEARIADKVGLMQDGAMLLEGSPDLLLKTWNVSTLEELFFEVYSNRIKGKPHNDFKESPNAQPASPHAKQTSDSVLDQRKDDCKSNKLTQYISQKLEELNFPNKCSFKMGTPLMISQFQAIVKKNIISLLTL